MGCVILWLALLGKIGVAFSSWNTVSIMLWYIFLRTTPEVMYTEEFLRWPHEWPPILPPVILEFAALPLSAVFQVVVI